MMLTPRETGRKLLHMIFGLLIAAAVHFGILDAARMLSVLVIGIAISFISTKIRIPMVSWFLERFERADAGFPGKGVVYFFAGAALSVLLFERDIATASIAILALGDSVAPLVGQFGSIKHPIARDKFVEGMLAGTIAAFLGASLFVKPHEALAASASAMIAEGVNIKLLGERLDDNVTMPVVAGAVISLLMAANI